MLSTPAQLYTRQISGLWQHRRPPNCLCRLQHQYSLHEMPHSLHHLSTVSRSSLYISSKHQASSHCHRLVAMCMGQPQPPSQAAQARGHKLGQRRTAELSRGSAKDRRHDHLYLCMPATDRVCCSVLRIIEHQALRCRLGPAKLELGFTISCNAHQCLSPRMVICPGQVTASLAFRGQQ